MYKIYQQLLPNFTTFPQTFQMPYRGGGQHCFTWFGGGTNFSRAVLLVGGGHYFEKNFARFVRNVLSFHGNLHLKSTMMHFVTLILLYIAL